MLLSHSPTVDDWNRLNAAVDAAPLTYAAVGCSWNAVAMPAGFNVDRAAITLGLGREAFDRACAALDAWRMFPRPMTRLFGADRSPHVGQIVAVVFRPLGLPLWGLFPCRVLKLFNHVSATKVEHGFSYGTLPGHAEAGEELFRVTWDRTTDQVTYDILAVSRPHTFLARLGYPYCRLQQAKFRRLSCAAMHSAGVSP